jgi:hypothetical protein
MGEQSVTEQRDETLDIVESQLENIVETLVPIYGDRYTFSVTIDGRKWELKWDDATIKWARVKTGQGKVYLYSNKSTPDPKKLVEGMDTYEDFIQFVNNKLNEYENELEQLDTPPLPDGFEQTAEAVTNTYENKYGEFEDKLATVAGHLHDIHGGYGTYSTEINGKTWELKYSDSGDANYLRIGGRGGTYLLGDYGPPSLPTFLKYRDDIVAFFEAVKSDYEDQETALDEINL